MDARVLVLTHTHTHARTHACTHAHTPLTQNPPLTTQVIISIADEQEVGFQVSDHYVRKTMEAVEQEEKIAREAEKREEEEQKKREEEEQKKRQSSSKDVLMQRLKKKELEGEEDARKAQARVSEGLGGGGEDRHDLDADLLAGESVRRGAGAVVPVHRHEGVPADQRVGGESGV